MTLTFEKNGTCEMLVATDYHIKQDGVPITVAGGVTVPGTYTLNGKDLKMNLNRSKAEVEFDYDVKGMDAKTKAIMDKTMEPEFNGMKKEFKDMMLNGMPKMHNMKTSRSRARNSSSRTMMVTKSPSTPTSHWQNPYHEECRPAPYSALHSSLNMCQG